MEAHFKSNHSLYNLTSIKDQQILNLKMEVLANDPVFTRNWPNFKQELTNSPEEVLGLIGLAIHHRIIANLPPSDQEDFLQIYHNLRLNTNKIHVRILGFGPLMKINSFLKDGHGKLVTVRGAVLKIEAIKFVCKWMAFKCSLCQSLMIVKQKPKEMINPSRCLKGCKAASNFIPMRSSPFTRVVSSQLIHLREYLEREKNYFSYYFNND